MAETTTTTKLKAGTKEYMRWYYLQNREKLLKRAAAYHKANPNVARQAHRRYKSKNREALSLYYKTYHAKNAEATKRNAIQSQAVRRARKRKAIVGNTKLISRWVKHVKSRSHSICYYCHLSVPTKRVHIDHIVAINNGGAHSIENLCVSCDQCNWSKCDTPIQAWYKLGQQILSL